MEKLGRQLYRTVGISEWEEKCLVLSKEEQVSILNNIKENREDELLRIVKLPYHRFIVEYLKSLQGLLAKRRDRSLELENFITGDGLLKKDIGYKLYIIPDLLMLNIMRYIKEPEATFSSIFDGSKTVGSRSKDLMDYLNCPLDSMYKMTFSTTISNTTLKKYVHIMGYVSAKEAEELGLTSLAFYQFGEYKGFDLKEKLESLNPFIRHIYIRYFGLDGAYSSSKEIAEETGTKRIVDVITKDYLEMFVKSCADFRHKIKYVDKDYQYGERIEYLKNPCDKRTFYKDAESVEYAFIKKYLEENGIGEIDGVKFSFKNTGYYLNAFDMNKALSDVSLDKVKVK